MDSFDNCQKMQRRFHWLNLGTPWINGSGAAGAKGIRPQRLWWTMWSLSLEPRHACSGNYNPSFVRSAQWTTTFCVRITRLNGFLFTIELESQV